jgi:hypothetical protein
VGDDGPLSKGVHFTSLQAYIVRSHGDAAWPRVLARLARDDRDAVTSSVAVGWYPTPLLLRVTDAAVDELERPGESFRASLGRHNAEHQLRIIHRLFLRAASPGYVLEKAGQLWSRFHDTGTWTIERDRSSARGALAGFVVHAGFCQSLTAYITRLFELVGARDVHVEHARCRARGDEVCVWAGQWR